MVDTGFCEGAVRELFPRRLRGLSVGFLRQKAAGFERFFLLRSFLTLTDALGCNENEVPWLIE